MLRNLQHGPFSEIFFFEMCVLIGVLVVEISLVAVGLYRSLIYRLETDNQSVLTVGLGQE